MILVSSKLSSAAASVPFTIDLVARRVAHSGGILGSGGSAPGAAAVAEAPPPPCPRCRGLFGRRWPR